MSEHGFLDNLNLIRVTCKYITMQATSAAVSAGHTAGSPARGYVRFTPSTSLTDADTGEVVVPASFDAMLDSDGVLDIDLPATDDPDLEPTGWTYKVTEKINGRKFREYHIEIPVAGGDVDLVDAVPPGTASAGDAASYARTSAVDAAIEGRQRRHLVDIREYGIVGDGVADDTQGLTDLANDIRAGSAVVGPGVELLYIPPSAKVRITSTVDLTRIPHMEILGEIVVDHNSTPGLYVGHDGTTDPSEHHINRVSRGASSTDSVLLRLTGIRRGNVTVGDCENIEIYANASHDEGGVQTRRTVSYSTFRIGNCTNFAITGEAPNGDGDSWINDNYFICGDWRHITIGGVGQYQHNNNTFIQPTLDSGDITIYGHSNAFYHMRMEQTNNIAFKEGAHNNHIYVQWSASEAATSDNVTTLESHSPTNIVVHNRELAHTATELLRVDANRPFFHSPDTADWSFQGVNGETSKPPVPGFDLLLPTGDFVVAVDTGKLPIESDVGYAGGTCRMYRFSLDSDASVWRWYVFGYDSDGVSIDPTVTPWMSTIGGWSASSTRYDISTNRDGNEIVITDDVVKYIRIRINYGNGVTSTPFRYLSIAGWTPQPGGDRIAESWTRALSRPPHLTGTPSKGLAHAGLVVGSDTGARVCTHRVDMVLDSAASATDTVISVDSAVGTTAGDLIAVELDDGLTHWTTIASRSSNDLTLDDAMPSAASVGLRVATNRWSSLT